MHYLLAPSAVPLTDVTFNSGTGALLILSHKPFAIKEHGGGKSFLYGFCFLPTCDVMERMLADLRTLRFRIASSSSSSSNSSPTPPSTGTSTLREEQFDLLEANVDEEGVALSGEAWLNRRLR